MSTQRKFDHIDLFSKDRAIERNSLHFDRIHLSHRALPEIALDEVNSQVSFLRKMLSFPFIISSMTGGNAKKLIRLNQNLAMAAQNTNIAMGVGSQRVTLTDNKAIKSFQLRKFAPSIPLIANIGAVQLNYGMELAHIDEIIAMLDADALYLHFNPLQEAIQPEGNTDFSSLGEKVQAVVEHVQIPVIAKEVGCGFSLPDLHILKQAGIQWIETAGRGGTSWSRLENHRRKSAGLEDDLGLVFQDWGIPTPKTICLIQQCGGLKTIASGGLRNGMDMMKSVVLGAKMCSMAAPLLPYAQQGSQPVIDKITQLRQEFRLALFLLGCQHTEQARNNADLLI